MRGLIQAVMDQESDFRPSVVSNKGAVGLMQVRPQFAFDYGYGAPDIADVATELGYDVPDRTRETAHQLLLDPVINERMGTGILEALIKNRSGNVRDALTAYNMGMPAYKEWLAAGGDRSTLDPEARKYAPGVFENYRRLFGEELPETLFLKTPRARPAGLLSR